MRDILPDLDRWRAQGRTIALATVVETWGSSPRRAGAKMAVTSAGGIAGSVSGGCVEAAVVEAAMEALKTNLPHLLHFSVADETAWDVGLACGGSLDIFVQPLDTKLFQTLRSTWSDESPAAAVTVIRGPDDMLGRGLLLRMDGSVTSTLGDELDARVLELSHQALAEGASRRVKIDESFEVFIEVISPPPTLVAVGGVHIAIALASLAHTLGYRTVVVDPRGAFGSEERFPHADQLIHAWPDEAFKQIRLTSSTAVAMLTHDPKLDDPALTIALPSPAFYVGALGSRATNARRRERLLQAGLTEDQLARLHAPIGLEIGAETPEEIALAIMAEVVEARKLPRPAERLAAAHPHQTPSWGGHQ